MTFYANATPEKPSRKKLLIFYGEPSEGNLAKDLASQARKSKHDASPRDATAFSGDNFDTGVEGVLVLPKVRRHHRDRIAAVYGDIVTDYQEGAAQSSEQELSGGADDLNKKTAVNRGRGRWFVVRGEETLSGPHSEAEAKELAGSTL